MIQSIKLFDDVHTATAWRVLEEYTHIPVEHIMVERIKAHKSQVDMRLALRTQQEFYENNVDSFILVSSDSDYWALIDSVKKARFLVMVERESCSPDMKKVLVDRGIFYCYIDDFYSGNAEGLKFGALFKEFYRYIDSHMSLNLKEMMNEALIATRLDMTPAEQKQFYDKYLKTTIPQSTKERTYSGKKGFVPSTARRGNKASRSSKTQSTIWEIKPPLITGCRPRAMQKDLFFSYWQWLECVRMAYGKVIEPILRGFKTCIFFGLNLFFKQRRYFFKTKAKII